MPQGDRIEFNNSFQAVAASATDQLLGRGKISDILERVVIQVTTSATSSVSIKDASGGASIPVVPINHPLGGYTIELGVLAKTNSGTRGWHVTTGAGVTVLAVGRF